MAPPTPRENVRAMQGYTPGEQPAPDARIIKLNTNENPFPPSPRVLEAIREVDGESLRRYPQPLADRFRAAAAKLHGVHADQIIAGNGSDDILNLATRAFIQAGGTLASVTPTYALYSVLARIEDAKFVTADIGEHGELPIEALLRLKADAIYLPNPNTPTGALIELDAITTLAERFGKLLLIDEAYGDFAPVSHVPLLAKRPNILITRTLSKGYSLAGLRFGYGIAHPDLIAQLVKVKDSYNCDAISILAATAALEDQPYAQQCWQRVREERDRLTQGLMELGFSVLPSHANFVLASGGEASARPLYEGLKAQGILVRYFDSPGLADKLRITVGTSQENNALLSGLAALRQPSSVA